MTTGEMMKMKRNRFPQNFIINYDIKYRMGGDLPAEASAQAGAAEDDE